MDRLFYDLQSFPKFRNAVARDVSRCFAWIRGHVCAVLLPVLAAAVFSGCVSFDAEKERIGQIDDFTNRLTIASAELLAKPLTLEESIAIALTNNYEVRKADVDRKLAKLGRKTAFAAFLPQVSAAAGYNSYEKDPQTTSRKFDTQEISVGMPIFMPSTWFLYDAAKHGFAVGEISANYTRQSIVLKTTDNFCNIIVQQDLVSAYEVQLEAARKNADRVMGLAREGLVAKWEGEQSEYIAETRLVQLNQARRNLAVLKARFLADLGLDPKFGFSLVKPEESSAAAEAGSVEDLVSFALGNHPLLSIADREVVIKENGVRQAFCELIPTASVFGKESWTGNKVMSVTPNLVTGFNAAWDIFSGVTIAKYKASKVELEKSRLERENTFLSVIVNVVSAEAAWRDALESRKIAKRAFDIASSKYADWDAKSREGLVPVSDALDALAVKDLAQVELVKLTYAERTAKAALDFATGKMQANP